MGQPLNRVTCEEAFRKLDDFLDRQLRPEETRVIEEHLAICAACTHEFAFEASVLQGIRRKLPRIAAPPDLLSKVSAQIARVRGDPSAAKPSATD